MVQNIDPKYLDKIAIVTVGYNRQKSLSRLLDSLVNAIYPSNDIPLVISIDCSGDQGLYQYVKEFKWPHGEKIINIQQERLGLLKHIYQCGDLTRYFRAVILLEDDLFVSPYFYYYTKCIVEKYGNCSKIAEISLYKNETNGYVNFPFENIQNGLDVFLHQDVSTWGQCWTASMWADFCKWRDSHFEEDIQNADMPEKIKTWTRAWSKYFNAYVVQTNRYIVFPNVSLTTNFSDAGEHGYTNNSIVQVNLQQGKCDYRLGDLHKLVKYDIYGNNEDIYSWLNLHESEVRLDLYGFFDNCTDRKYILSTRRLPYKVVKSFALFMRPLELNIKYNLNGEGIFLYDTSVKGYGDRHYSTSLTNYFLKGYNIKALSRFMIFYYRRMLYKKIKW